jgi:pyridoxamine 5'-phosphate oxidase
MVSVMANCTGMNSNDAIYRQAVAGLQALMDDAQRRGEPEPNAASLATASASGQPSVRTVNVAHVDVTGIAIFVDVATGKASQMLENPRAALCFHWRLLRHQAIVEGASTMLSEIESDELWRHHPRDYGLARWASDQSAPGDTIGAMNDAARNAGHRHSFERVPRPPAWRAFRIDPDRVDLWPSGWRRLHSCLRYSKTATGWIVVHANP